VADTFIKVQSDLNPVDIKELPNKVKAFIGWTQ
jgi:hypothetical protein